MVLAQFRSKNRTWENYTKQAACLVQFTQFRSKNRNWAVWPSVGTSSLQNRSIPLLIVSARKVTNSSWRQEGTFLTSPGEKSRELTEKSCVRFPLPQNCRPPHERRRSGWFKHSTRRGWISSKRTCSVQYVKDEQGRLRHDMQLIRDPWVQCSALYSILQ